MVFDILCLGRQQQAVYWEDLQAVVGEGEVGLESVMSTSTGE